MGIQVAWDVTLCFWVVTDVSNEGNPVRIILSLHVPLEGAGTFETPRSRVFLLN